MIQIILSIIIILTIIFTVQCILRPKRLYNAYLRDIQKIGCKVYNIPFVPLRAPYYKILRRDEKQSGDPLKIHKTIYTTNDIILTNFFNRIVLDLSHPDFIKDYYSNEHLYTYPKVKFFTANLVRVVGKGVLLSQGLDWKRKRRILNAVFNFQFVKAQTGKIHTFCDKAIKDIEDIAIHTHQNGEHIVEYDIFKLNLRMFSSVVLQCFLGGSTDAKLQGKPLCLFLVQLADDVIKQGFDPLSVIFGQKFFSLGVRAHDRDINRRLKIYSDWGMRYVSQKMQQAKKAIIKNQNNSESDDIITALVRSGIKNQNCQYTNSQKIFQEFTTFFFAGTDTTSHFVLMMIYYIALNQNVQEKLRAQIKQHMSNNDYSYENLKKLTYIDYIQKQTTRMYGPVNSLFFRQAKEDTYLNGLPVRKGTVVTLNVLGNHYSQKYFRDPFIFRPQRWQNQCQNIPPFVLGGFSAGARTCIGKHLAMIQSKIGLIIFMKRYKKIALPIKTLKMIKTVLYSPQQFTTKLTIDEKLPSNGYHD